MKLVVDKESLKRLFPFFFPVFRMEDEKLIVRVVPLIALNVLI